MTSTKKSLATWGTLVGDEERYSDEAYPKVSVVIPTLNCAHSIGDTLESVFEQDYPDYEILIIDGGSTDRTLEVVKSYRQGSIRLFAVGTQERYEMLNIGITHADGLYINFLFPGDYYLYHRTLRLMMGLALDYHKPHLVFCGAVLRDVTHDVKMLYRPLNLELLKLGRQPTSLESCWIRVDTFKEIGKFPTDYALRGGFDFMCRFCLAGTLRSASIRRALTDYDLRGIGRRAIFRHFWETMRSIYRYFGIKALFRWLLVQKDMSRFFRLWQRSLRVAFLGH